MTKAVTSSVIYTSQMEAGTDTSPTIVRTSKARERVSRRQWGTGQPKRDHCESVARSSEGHRTPPQVVTMTEPPRIEWTLTGAEPGWASVETNSWEEFEEAAQQSVQGTTEEVMDYVLDVWGQVQTEVENQMERQAETVQVARGREDFGQPNRIRNLMGRMRHVWNCNIRLQERVETLETEKQELVTWQTEAMNTNLDLQSRLAELKREESRLQQKLEKAQALPTPAVAPPGSGTASDGTKFFKDTADRLEQDCFRLRGERS